MLPEIFFLVALRENNRKLWVRSFPFHFGLYLVIGCTFLMAASGLLSAGAPEFLEGIRGTLLQSAIAVTGCAGVSLSILGALGLLQQRLTSSDLRDYTAPADIFNLLFFIVVFGIAFAHFALFDPDFSATTLFVRNLMLGNMAQTTDPRAQSVLPAITVCGMSLLVIYIPLTHMSHFIGKYFAYHSIRWNDSPNLPGGKQEIKIRALLERPVSWSAPHIGGNGNKSWLDLAAESSREDQNK
jgi:nitrate reductase gamma subunit